jgi:hypothetical protein
MAIFGSVPPTARFAFLATGNPNLLYVDQDGKVYKANDQSPMAILGSVPASARFVFLASGNPNLLCVSPRP